MYTLRVLVNGISTFDKKGNITTLQPKYMNCVYPKNASKSTIYKDIKLFKNHNVTLISIARNH